jgi:pSer/pThr/pTyr-binding forkhead associated (FHA) protein
VSGVDLQSSGDPASATAFLVDLVSNRKIPITTPRCKVGRDDLNDIVISGDQSISRFHFVITKENAQYLVQDGKSRHGTFLNGNQIGGPEPIHDGDVLKVGVSLFWFVIEAQVAQASPEKTSPVDIEATEQVLEFMPADSKELAAMQPAADAVVSQDETIAPKPPDWVHTLDSLAGDQLDGEAISLEPVESNGKDAEETGKAAGAAPESPAEDPIKAEHSLDEAEHSAGTSEDRALEASLEAPQEPTMDSQESESLKEETAPVAKTVAEEQSDVIEKTEVSAEGTDDQSVEPTASSDHSASAELITDKDKETAEPSGTSEDDWSTKASNSQDHDRSDNPLVISADAITEVYSITEQSDQIESEPTTIEHQFSLSEDQINRAANRIADSFALAEAEDSSYAAEEKSKAESSESKPQETLDKLADIVGEAQSDSMSPEPAQPALTQYLNAPEADNKSGDKHRSKDKHFGELTTNGAKVMSIVKESASNATVPDWCKKYFSAELTHLDKELTELNEEVHSLQAKIKDVEGRTSLTKGLRNILLTTQGDELVDACGKIFAMMGWRVRVSDEDKLELKMEADDKSVCIARVVWTDKEPDRSHLGQLSISQTRYWCEVGVEPKGVLIIARAGDQSGLPLSGEYAHELADYASKKNVCLMSTLQLLSCYKEVFLHDGSPDSVRSTVQSTSGWLHGFQLEPGDGNEPSDRTDGSAGGKTSLSSLLSA